MVPVFTLLWVGLLAVLWVGVVAGIWAIVSVRDEYPPEAAPTPDD